MFYNICIHESNFSATKRSILNKTDNIKDKITIYKNRPTGITKKNSILEVFYSNYKNNLFSLIILNDGKLEDVVNCEKLITVDDYTWSPTYLSEAGNPDCYQMSIPVELYDNWNYKMEPILTWDNILDKTVEMASKYKDSYNCHDDDEVQAFIEFVSQIKRGKLKWQRY